MLRRISLGPSIVLCLLCLVSAAGVAADIVDVANVERRKLDSPPEFIAEKPLYALAVFGPEAKMQVWLILDKSKADAEQYNVLWADLSGDGRFDARTERFECAAGGDASTLSFSLGEFTDPTTKDRHTNFHVSIDLDRPICMIKLDWKGQEDRRMAGGYAPVGDAGYMRFAESASDAPLVWFNGDGPFRFQRWYSETMPIGGKGDLKLFLGQEGVGTHTFCAFTGHVLPDGEPVVATLVYVDQDGKEQRELYELAERC